MVYHPFAALYRNSPKKTKNSQKKKPKNIPKKPKNSPKNSPNNSSKKPKKPATQPNNLNYKRMRQGHVNEKGYVLSVFPNGTLAYIPRFT